MSPLLLVICLPGRGVVGIGSKSDHAPPFAHSVRTFAKANCPHRIPFNLRFLPAPMAVYEISLVQFINFCNPTENFWSVDQNFSIRFCVFFIQSS